MAALKYLNLLIALLLELSLVSVEVLSQNDCTTSAVYNLNPIGDVMTLDSSKPLPMKTSDTKAYCPIRISSSAGIKMEVDKFNIGCCFVMDFAKSLYQVAPSVPQIVWSGETYAELMVFEVSEIYVYFNTTSPFQGQGQGVVIHFSSLATPQQCLKYLPTLTASEKPKLLYPPGFPFASDRQGGGIGCKWIISKRSDATENDFLFLQLPPNPNSKICPDEFTPGQSNVSTSQLTPIQIDYLSNDAIPVLSSSYVCGERDKNGFFEMYGCENVTVNYPFPNKLDVTAVLTYSVRGRPDFEKCDEQLTVSSSPVVLTKTFSPNNFLPSMSICKWTVSTPDTNKAIKLVSAIVDFGDHEDGCPQGDKVHVFVDIEYGDGTLLTSYCTPERSQGIVGPSNSMLIEAVMEKRFFRPLTMQLTFETTPITGCGGTRKIIQVQEGGDYHQLTSPGYPNPYPDNSYCQWNLVTTDANKKIEIIVWEADFTTCQNCSESIGYYLDVYFARVPNDTWSEYTAYRRIQKLSDQGTQMSFEADSEALIVFHSRQYSTGKGFRLQYRLVPKPQQDTTVNVEEDNNGVTIIVAAVFGVIAFVALVFIILGVILYKRGYCRKRNEVARDVSGHANTNIDFDDRSDDEERPIRYNYSSKEETHSKYEHRSRGGRQGRQEDNGGYVSSEAEQRPMGRRSTDRSVSVSV